MGYNTNFTLTIDFGDLAKKAPNMVKMVKDHMKEKLTAMHGGTWVASELFDDYNAYAKWYEWEADMRTLSLAFPGYLFTLEGDGEESDDFWIAYFRGGKMQYCKGERVYPDFDESLMH